MKATNDSSDQINTDEPSSHKGHESHGVRSQLDGDENENGPNGDAEDVELCIEEDGFQEVPEELQCEEVDMNDPNMDPLEWSARKLIPIPKAYYWDTQNENIPLKTKAWHHTVSALGSSVRFAENVGEVAANFLGLNTSRYDYVTSTMTDEDWERARNTASERRLKRESFRKQQEVLKIEREVADSIGAAQDVI